MHHIRADVLTVVVVAILMTASTSFGAKILLVPVQFKSHMLTQFIIGEELARRGHEVFMTIDSQFPNSKETIESLGIRTISFQVPDGVDYPVSDESERKMGEIIFDGRDALAKLREGGERVSKMGLRLCELMMEDAAFVDAVRQLKFDLAIVDAFMLCPCNPFCRITSPSRLFLNPPASFRGTSVCRPCRRPCRCSAVRSRTATGCRSSNGSRPSASY